MNGQLHTHVALPQGNQHLVPIGSEAWWAPGPVWEMFRTISLLSLPGIEPRL
jgi:hypothetical protein